MYIYNIMHTFGVGSEIRMIGQVVLREFRTRSSHFRVDVLEPIKKLESDFRCLSAYIDTDRFIKSDQRFLLSSPTVDSFSANIRARTLTEERLRSRSSSYEENFERSRGRLSSGNLFLLHSICIRAIGKLARRLWETNEIV